MQIPFTSPLLGGSVTLSRPIICLSFLIFKLDIKPTSLNKRAQKNTQHSAITQQLLVSSLFPLLLSFLFFAAINYYQWSIKHKNGDVISLCSVCRLRVNLLQLSSESAESSAYSRSQGGCLLGASGHEHSSISRISALLHFPRCSTVYPTFS